MFDRAQGDGTFPDGAGRHPDVTASDGDSVRDGEPEPGEDLPGGLTGAAAPWLAPDLLGRLPGSDLAEVLERGSAEGADDFALVEAVAAWQRLAAWAAAGAARAAAELAERPSMNPAWPESAGKVAELNVAGEELAMRLGCSRMMARSLVRDGRAFIGPLAATGDALSRGEIDPGRARAMVRALEDVPVPLALEVQDTVLPGAAGRTAAQLTQDVGRAMIALDPGGARVRHHVAVRGRRLDRPRAMLHGMASVCAVLPAVDAMRLDAGIDALARSARTSGDPRTLDQLRADILVDLTLGELDGSPAPWTAPLPDDDPASQGTAHQQRAADQHRAADQQGTGGPSSQGRGAGLRRQRGLRAQIRVTVPLSSLLGTDGAPAELAGYGPITAEATQALARGGTWRRIVTDPVTGAVLDVGRTRYRPPEDLAEHVRARDATCVRPGCSASADSCDLDHVEEFGRSAGTTSAANLAPLCRRDHTVKTDGGFRLERVAPGVFEWVTPTGHRYRVAPGTRTPTEHLSARRGDPPDDAPPF